MCGQAFVVARLGWDGMRWPSRSLVDAGGGVRLVGPCSCKSHVGRVEILHGTWRNHPISVPILRWANGHVQDRAGDSNGYHGFVLTRSHGQGEEPRCATMCGKNKHPEWHGTNNWDTRRLRKKGPNECHEGKWFERVKLLRRSYVPLKCEGHFLDLMTRSTTKPQTTQHVRATFPSSHPL